jgi:hypothetical protein
MSSSEPAAGLDVGSRQTLLQVARTSLVHGLRYHAPPPLDPERYPEVLRQPGASFVTLLLEGALRGCIGSLEACRPVVADVARHAFAAGFEDPRFPPLNEAEIEQLGIEISLLSALERIAAADEESLLAALRPGTHGLLMTCGEHHATFLPVVWQQLEDPYVFLSQLRYKAGLPLDYWSAELSFHRYTTESFAD